MKKTILIIFFIISLQLLAKTNTQFEFCSETMDKNGMHYQLGQAWFNAGTDADEAKPLLNWKANYSPPLSYDFTFTTVGKNKLWIDCVYFPCGDVECSTDNRSNELETVHEEVTKVPLSCHSQTVPGDATRLQSFKCKYK